MEIEIPYPAEKRAKTAWSKNFGLNSIYAGKHWSVRKRDSELWHYMTLSALNRAGYQMLRPPVSISFYWNDRLDLSNHAYMAKMIEDGLKGRVIEDDSRKYVTEIHHYFWDEPKIKIKIEEVLQ